MPRWRRVVHGSVAALLLSGVGGCAVWAGAGGVLGLPPLRERVDALLAEPPFDGVQWGVLATDAETGELLYERNPAVRFIPASNQKIPVTVAAMDLLGPAYRWDTPFMARTFPEDGVVEGDLVLVGSGDPTLGEPFFESAEHALEAVVEALRDAGIERVTGALVLDASRWDSTSVPESWMVEDLVATAGATGGPFVLWRGELEIRVTGAPTPGDPAQVEWSPMGASTFVEANVATESPDVGPDIAVDYHPESRRWTVTGTIGPEREATRTVPARDPVRLALDALERAMADAGIVAEGGVRIHWDRGTPVGDTCVAGELDACPDLVAIAELRSLPLGEVVAAILGPSQNWMTEQLVRTVGAEVGSEGSWPEGLRVIQEHLRAAAGVDSLALRMEDGSGLSAKNLLSPRAMVAILAHARGSTWFYSFAGAMARPGGPDTTLEDRLAGLEGRLFAKTGTITNVNSLSGYLIRSDGREVIFSILSNGSNLSSDAVRDRIDELVREVARPEG